MNAPAIARVQCRGAVAFLHGFLGSVCDWDEMRQRCPESTAFPLPGHGGTEPPASFAEAVECVAGILASIGPVHVVGYSMGGRLALAAALQLVRDRRCRLRSLTIVSSTPGLRSGAARVARAREDDQRAEALECWGLERFVRVWYRLPLFASLQRRPALLQRLILRRSLGDASSLARALRAMTVGRQKPLWDDLPLLHCPVLWLAGEWDAAYAELAHHAAALSPRGRARIVPAAGHMPHLERPEYTFEQLREFWEETRDADRLEA